MTAFQQIIVEPLSQHKDAISLCAEWTFSEWGKHIPGRTKEYYVDLFNQYAQEKGIPFTSVALKGKTPIGMATLRTEEFGFEDTPYRPWVSMVFVDAAYRRLGAASALVTSLQEHAHNEGHSQLYLDTPDQEGLYSRLGWVTFEKVSDPIHPEDDTYVMRKILG